MAVGLVPGLTLGLPYSPFSRLISSRPSREGLNLCLCRSQISSQGLSQIEQPDHKFPGAFIGDAAEIKIIEHGAT